ncbi:galactose mutarotase [Pirellulales bacterium]|nr:galactose mutarotase [Pirellulales bacterium]
MHFHAENENGLRAKWFSRGATLAELHVPDARGNIADVVLGFDNEADYESEVNQYFGCATGRYANRIAGGRFQLEGREYQLAINNGPNHLHGGPERPLSSVDWKGVPLETSAGRGVRFRYISPDGEERYPGTLEVTIDYVLTNENALRIEYAASTDKPTPVNLTNHSYFNLAGHGAESVLDHELRIEADSYTPVDEHLVPTGSFASLEGTPLDFRRSQLIGARWDQIPNGYDHNYVLRGKPGILREIAELYDPGSGREMRCHTDQPGVQLYTAGGLNGDAGKGGRRYAKHSAVCLETQHFPDSPNHPTFPTTILNPGETYRHICVYEFRRLRFSG